MKEDSDFFYTKYYLALNYLRNKDFESFQQSSKNLINFLSNNQWKTLLLSLLQNLEEIFNANPKLQSEKINYYLDFLIFGQELTYTRQNRIESILSVMDSAEKDIIIRKNLLNDNLFIFHGKIDKSTVNYYQKTNMQIKIVIKAIEMLQLSETLVVEFNEKSYNCKIKFSDMIKEKEFFIADFSLLFDKIITGNRLWIESLEIQKEQLFIFILFFS